MRRLVLGDTFCARERVAGRVVGITSGVGVKVKPRRRSRAEADSREEELAMAVPPEGCRQCVREGGEVEGDINGGDDNGVDGPATDPLLLAL